jgi:hypothetical protein
MSPLFSPCTRLRDLLEQDNGRPDEEARELHEHNLDVSTEELLSAERAFTMRTCTPSWGIEIRLRG